MVRQIIALLCLFAVAACDKENDSGADPESKLLGERLIAEHGEGVLAQPNLVVYDTGWIVGHGNIDPDFDAKLIALGLPTAPRMSGGVPPVEVDERYSAEGVEFGIENQQKAVIVDATSSLAIRLTLGQAGLDALRTCEDITLDRVCKVEGELRARLDGIPANGAVLVDRGVEIARGAVKSGWVLFSEAPEVGDETRLELFLADGVRCSMSRWVVDPRDSCAM